jgi:hypothetical protein
MREGLTMTLNFQNDEGKQTSDKAGGTQKRMSHCIPRGVKVTKTHRILNNRDKMNPALRNLQLHLTQISNLQTLPQQTAFIT